MNETNSVYNVFQNDTEIYFLNDERLTWKAKGILSFILYQKDDFKIIRSNLMKIAPDGKNSLLSGLRELEKFSYLEPDRKKDSRGHFIGEYKNIKEFSNLEECNE